ncbi:MAG: DUF5719 family protein [Acidimicrobiales bacterium]
MAERRVAAIVAIAGLLALGGVADRTSASRPPIAPAPPAVPVAAPAGALASSWLCAGATGSSGGAAAGVLVVANPSPRPVDGTVTMMPSNHAALAPRPFQVGAGSRLAIPESVPDGAPWLGAAVVVYGGGVAVEQQVSGTLGLAATPCATAGAPQWYFPTGSTLRGSTDVVSLLNPYPADAIVDFSFVTDQGAEAPTAFQALVVPSRTMLAVDLGTHLRRRTTIATTVSVRTGQVVAWQTQVSSPPAPGTAVVGGPAPAGAGTGPLDPALPTGGVVLTLGAPSLGVRWWWPDSATGGGVTEQFVVYNPGRAAAQLRLSYGSGTAEAQAEPVTVGPASVVTVTTTAQSEPAAGGASDVTLNSTNGVPVVAARSVTALAPSSRTGLGVLLGGRMAAPRWLLAAGGATSHFDEWVEVQDPGPAPAQVSLSEVAAGGLQPLGGLQGLAVPAGGRVAVRVADHVAQPFGAALVVSATTPVVVERDIYTAGGLGIGLATGVPLAS